MKVEIENVKLVEENTLDNNGELAHEMPRYAGHLVKVVVLEEGVWDQEAVEPIKGEEPEIFGEQMEGAVYHSRLGKSQKTRKNFIRFLRSKGHKVEKSNGWTIVNSCRSFKCHTSVIYRDSNSDLLWYGLKVSELETKSKTRFGVVFLIRDSKKLLYLEDDKILPILQKAKKLGRQDYIHIHIVLKNGVLKFIARPGNNQEPIDVELGREYMRSWDEFEGKL